MTAQKKHITPYICVYEVSYFAILYPLHWTEDDEPKSKYVAKSNCQIPTSAVKVFLTV